jgi:hypothetical protein
MGKTKREKDYFDDVPDPILAEIFNELNTKELVQASTISKRWHKVANTEYLWKNNYRGTVSCFIYMKTDLTFSFLTNQLEAEKNIKVQEIERKRRAKKIESVKK